MLHGMELIHLWLCTGVVEAQVALTAAIRSSASLSVVSLLFLLATALRFFRSGESTVQFSTVTLCSLKQLSVHLAVCRG